MSKTSEAQKKASSKWNAKNKEKMKIVVLKSNTKSYIKQTNIEQIEEIEEWLRIRKENLK